MSNQGQDKTYLKLKNSNTLPKPPVTTFDHDEAMSIIIAFEFIIANPSIKMEINKTSYGISEKYLADIQPIRDKLIQFIKKTKVN